MNHQYHQENKTQNRYESIGNILSKEECEMRRTLPELVEWWHQKQKVLVADVGKFYDTIPAAHSQENIVKKFYEEIAPLRNLLTLYCSDHVQWCQPVIGSQTCCDARISLKGENEKIVNVEFGMCVDGHNERKSFDHLEEHGCSPMPYSITGGSFNFSQMTDETFNLIRSTAKKKSEKVKQVKQVNKLGEQETWIVMVFRDFYLDHTNSWDDDAKKEFSDFYDKEIEVLNDKCNKFFLLASSGKQLFLSQSFLMLPARA